MIDKELRKIFNAFLISFLFISILWVIKAIELTASDSFANLGVYPRSWQGLIGIFFMPLLHKDIYHLFNNSVAFIFFNTALFYFFEKQAVRMFFTFYFLPSFLVWIIGRESYHIGLSAMIFALASFEMFVGFFTKKREFVAFTFIIILLYGSMFWSVFPTKPQISWEGHLSGFMVGFVAAFIYSFKPQKKEKPNVNLTSVPKFENFTSTNSVNFKYTEKDRNGRTVIDD